MTKQNFMKKLKEKVFQSMEFFYLIFSILNIFLNGE